MKKNSIKARLKKVLKAIVLVLLCWFLAHTLFITIDGLSDNAKSADCILILGNTVHEDGTLSERLKSRLDKGLELYHSKLADKIIVSGAKGKEGRDEARAMKDYLSENGVRKKDIIVDNKGINTKATAVHFSKIAKRRKLKSVIVVSQFFHITRTKYALKNAGVQNIYSAHAEYFEARDLYSLLREFVGFYWYVIH